jgi:hypothetical protein
MTRLCKPWVDPSHPTLAFLDKRAEHRLKLRIVCLSTPTGGFRTRSSRSAFPGKQYPCARDGLLQPATKQRVTGRQTVTSTVASRRGGVP